MTDRLPSPGPEEAESLPLVNPMVITESELAMLDPVTMSELDFLLGHSSAIASPASNAAPSVPQSPLAHQSGRISPSSAISVSSPMLPSSPPVLSSPSPVMLPSNPVMASTSPVVLSSTPVRPPISPVMLSSSSPLSFAPSTPIGLGLLQAQIRRILAARSPVIVTGTIPDDPFQSPIDGPGTVQDGEPFILPQAQTPIHFQQREVSSSTNASPNMIRNQAYAPFQQEEILNGTDGLDDLFESPAQHLDTVLDDLSNPLPLPPMPYPFHHSQISNTPDHNLNMVHTQYHAPVQQQAVMEATNGSPNLIHNQAYVPVQLQGLLDGIEGLDDLFRSPTEGLGIIQSDEPWFLSQSSTPCPTLPPQVSGTRAPDMVPAQHNAPVPQQAVLDAMNGLEEPSRYQSRFPVEAERRVQSEPHAPANTNIPASPKEDRFAEKARRLRSALANAVQEWDGRPVRVVKRTPAPATSSGAKGSQAALRARLRAYAEEVIAELAPDLPTVSSPREATPSALTSPSKKRKRDEEEAELQIRFYTTSPAGTLSKRSRGNSTAPPEGAGTAAIAATDVGSSHQPRQESPRCKPRRAPCKLVPYPRSWAKASSSDILLFELKKAGSTWETIAKTHRDVARSEYTRSALRNRYFAIKKRLGDLPEKVPGNGQA
ncbi:hypothetical protein N7488_000850 [Penicillium malachiteum]|nr:hypothetical protein N7488_000850 [Penicillium malachiteum]